MGKKSKLVNRVMKNIDKQLEERGLDDDYEWYFAKSTSISDDPIILVEFPDNLTRGFDVEWEEREDDDWKSAAELVTTQIMQAINEFESTRNIDISTRPIINHELQEDLLIDRFNESFDEDLYIGGEINYSRACEENRMDTPVQNGPVFINEPPTEEFTDELANYYFSQQEEMELD